MADILKQKLIFEDGKRKIENDNNLLINTNISGKLYSSKCKCGEI